MQGFRSVIEWAQNRQGKVKNSIVNGKAKDLICTAHRHEISGGSLEEMGYQAEGTKGEYWVNCKSIINNIYF